jgi:hypothetical protein
MGWEGGSRGLRELRSFLNILTHGYVAKFCENHKSGFGFNFEAPMELRVTLCDLVWHPKINFWHCAQVSMVEFHENHESGLGFKFKAPRELCATIWDLVWHPKIIFWHCAHVSIVEFRENHESGLRFHARGTQGTTQRDTLWFGRAPQNQFLTLSTCFHGRITRKSRIRSRIS